MTIPFHVALRAARVKPHPMNLSTPLRLLQHVGCVRDEHLFPLHHRRQVRAEHSIELIGAKLDAGQPRGGRDGRLRMPWHQEVAFTAPGLHDHVIFQDGAQFALGRGLDVVRRGRMALYTFGHFFDNRELVSLGG